MPYKDPEVRKEKAAEFYQRQMADPVARERRRASARRAAAKRRKEKREATLAAGRRWYAKNAERERARNAAYKRANRARCTDLENKRQALKLNQYVEDVDRLTVLARDKSVCGLCGEMIDGDFHVDHIVPLSKGGLHSYANVQAAHPLCNIRKGNRV